jgi:hypothetical protein
MANKVVIKRTSVSGREPTASDIDVGELAVNLADKKLFTKDGAGTVIQLGGGSGSGDVVGPEGATDNAIARFDTTTGKIIQNSQVIIDDSGNTSGVNAVTFDTTPTTPPTTEGSLYWDSADSIQTLNLVMAGGNALQHIGEETYYRVKASSAITNGQVVMFTGTLGASGGLTAAPATGLTALTASYVMGIATQDIPLNDWGYITHFGEVKQIDTSAFSNGDILYYDPTVAGGLTASIPSAPNAKIQVCAVINSSPTVGILFVRPAFGGILGQYEGDVNITSPSSGNTLIYDAAQGRWENSSITGGTGLSVTNGAGTIALANTGVTSSIAGTGISVSGATGAVTITNSDRGSAQNIFKNVAVSGQSTIVADNNNDTLTVASGTGVSLTTNATTDTLTITNTAPDQTVSLSGGGTTTIGGTYPNFTISSSDQFTGTVTSVAASVPTGLTVTGSPIISSGTLAISYTAGYSIPTTAKQTQWDTAYTDRNKWDGGATGLVASTGRTSLGGTTLGSNIFTITNPSAITFPRFNADNSVSALSATDFRTAIGAGTGNGTVTSVGGTAPIASSGGATPTISITQSSSSTNGFLSSTDWNTFNNKQATLVSGTNIKTINGNSVLGSGNLTVSAAIVYQ